MAVRTVDEALANAKGTSSLVGNLIAVVNELSTALNVVTAQLDADAGVTDTDYAANAGTMDTIAYRNTTTPT